MQSKPERFGTAYAEAFKDQRVVDFYRYRPPYPAEVFDILVALISDEPRSVLDVGAGSGRCGRLLTEHDPERQAPTQWGCSALALDLWQGGGGAALASIRADHGGIEYSLDGLASSFPALSLLTHSSWLPCPDASPHLAHALGR